MKAVLAKRDFLIEQRTAFAERLVLSLPGAARQTGLPKGLKKFKKSANAL